jgi:hypothetical protein
VAALLVIGCGEGPAPDPAAGWSGSIEALPDGGERVASPAAPAWGEDGGWRLEERLRVGSGTAADGSPGPTFGQIPDLAPTPDGGAWILDGEAREVVRVDKDGREVRRLGGPGDGPDRFEYPRRLHLRGDTVWVEDLGRALWSAWDTAGAFLAAFDLPPGLAGGNAAWRADGLVGVERRRVDGDVLRAAGRWVPRGGAFVRVDSFPAPPVPAPLALQSTVTRQGRPVTLAFPLPLAHQPSAVPHPEGGGWIVTPGAGEYRILRVEDSGRVQREVARAFDPVPVPEAEWTGAVDRLPPELREANAERVPRTYPPFDRVVAGTDGGLWVVRRVAGDSGGTRVVLDLFDARGRYLGPVASEVALDGFWLHHAGDGVVWGVRRDEEGRPVALRLEVAGG